MNELKEERRVQCAVCEGKGSVVLPAEAETVEAYYFGYIENHGHVWANRRGYQNVRTMDEYVPSAMRGGKIDGMFDHDRTKMLGDATLHYLDRWTVLHWTDLSGDTRPGSHSNIIVKGTYGFTDMKHIAEVQYPWVMQRQQHPLKLVES